MNSFFFSTIRSRNWEAAAVMESYEQTEEGTSPLFGCYFPIEVIENILTKLPVKSLIRFQSVSKLWHSIISDPQFCRIHYDTMRDSALCFVGRSSFSQRNDPISLVKVENKKLGTECVFELPFYEYFGEYVGVAGSCNGILLLVTKCADHTRLVFGLWNPSIRKYSNWTEPYPYKRQHVTFGFYYDSTSDDYKIPVIFCRWYGVYSFKSRSWGELKAFPSTATGYIIIHLHELSCFYWRDSEGVVGFDVRDEKLSKIPLPIVRYFNSGAYGLEFIEVSGRLCLYYGWDDAMRALWVMEKHDDSWSWRELVNDEKARGWSPLVVTNEDYLVVCIGICDGLGIYDCVEKSSMKLDNREFYWMLPYSESLYFPDPNVRGSWGPSLIYSHR